MKITKLNKIHITNFKGIANGIFNFNGENTEIVADVMQGKTSVKQAFLWALGLEIDNFYPVNKNNQLIEGLETSVELDIYVDGINYTLSRTAKIKYKNKAFDGFKKDMFKFDGVPCTTTEYKTKLCDLFGVEDFETIKYLSVLNYFNEQVNWKERRALLYSLFVDKSSIENLNNDEKYNLIANELKKGKTSADISTMLNSENNKLVDSKRKNEILLADKKSELNNYANINYANIESELEMVEKGIADEQERLEELNKNNIKKQLSIKILELSKEAGNLQAQDHLTYSDIEYSYQALEKKCYLLKNKGEICEKAIEEETTLYKTIKAKQFNQELTICPECGRPLDEQDAQKVKADWEEHHEKRLQEIKTSVLELKKEYETIKEEYMNKLAELESKKQELDNFKTNSKIAELENEIQKLNEQLAKDETIEIDTYFLDELKGKRNFLIVELGKKDSHDKLKAKIASLYAEQRELVNAEIVLAKKRQQLEQYTLDIISLVNDSINSHFDGVKFKLFEELTASSSKSIKETLVCLNHGIDYSSQSTGQRANSNCIIVSTLQKKLGVNLPIWLEDASILNLSKEPDNQLIYLLNCKGKKLDCTRIDEVY